MTTKFDCRLTGFGFTRKITKSMPIGAAIKPSSFSPLVTNVAASDHFNIQFGRLSLLKDGQLNKNHRGFNLQQRPKAKLSASEFSQNAPQIDGKSLGETFNVFCRFTRFYSLRGSVLAVVTSCLLAIQTLSDFTPSFFHGILPVIIGAGLANSFVVAINQLTDIEIDKINKPYLPLASGELSVKTGILLTVLYAILGLSVALYIPSWPFKVALFLWYALGTAYSVHLPLLRWKENPMLTFVVVWSFRVLIPIFFYLHAQVYIFGRPLLLSKHVIFSSGMMSVFAIVIAFFKDLSDVEGDTKNGIKTLASQLGQTRTFWICIWLLEMAFGMGVYMGLSSTHPWIGATMAMSHIIIGFILWKKANMVDHKSAKDFNLLYMLIWKIVYVEYLLLSTLRF